MTRRESEIIQLMLKGSTNQEIGRLLFITEKTVNNHMVKIKQNYNVRTRSQLIVYFKNRLKDFPAGTEHWLFEQEIEKGRDANYK